jgi:hypothetical protein
VEAILIVDNAQLHADPAALRVFRAKHDRVITLPPHCTHCMQSVDVAWAGPCKDRFSASVRAQTDHRVLRLLTMLTGEPVTGASEAMKERATFVMCDLDAYHRTPPWSTCMPAFEVSRLDPLNPTVVLRLPDVRHLTEQRRPRDGDAR